MLLMVEKGIRGGICHGICRYSKANNKYMKKSDKNTTYLYLMYLDANNFYGWTMSQKLPVNGFEWIEELSQFIEDFIKDYDENSDEEYFLKIDVKYAKNLFNIHSDLPFLPERKKIKTCNNLVCNMHEKENFVIHIRALKEALNHRLIRKKSTRSKSIQSKRTEVKNDFEMDLFKLMDNSVLENNGKCKNAQRY